MINIAQAPETSLFYTLERMKASWWSVLAFLILTWLMHHRASVAMHLSNRQIPVLLFAWFSILLIWCCFCGAIGCMCHWTRLARYGSQQSCRSMAAVWFIDNWVVRRDKNVAGRPWQLLCHLQPTAATLTQDTMPCADGLVQDAMHAACQPVKDHSKLAMGRVPQQWVDHSCKDQMVMIHTNWNDRFLITDWVKYDMHVKPSMLITVL